MVAYVTLASSRNNVAMDAIFRRTSVWVGSGSGLGLAFPLLSVAVADHDRLFCL